MSQPEWKTRSIHKKIGGKDVYILGVVLGLDSEGDIVRDALNELKPDLIGLSIPPEGMRGLEAVVDGKIKSVYPSRVEIIYARHLSMFGEVSTPPRVYVVAYRYAKKKGVKILPLDIGEPEFSRIYTEEISTMELIRYSMLANKLEKMKVRSSTPEDFAMEWDARVNALKGYRRVEERREEHMAMMIKKFASRLKFNTMLVVAEYPRYRGIASHL